MHVYSVYMDMHIYGAHTHRCLWNYVAASWFDALVARMLTTKITCRQAPKNETEPPDDLEQLSKETAAGLPPHPEERWYVNVGAFQECDGFLSFSSFDRKIPPTSQKAIRFRPQGTS